MAVTCWYNSTNPVGRFHLLEACEGLDSTNRDLIVRRRFTSWTALLRADKLRRPCRVCALADATVGALNGPIGSVRTLVSFASQPPFQDWRAAHRDPSDTGTARLREIAAQLDWPVVATAIGPVTYGYTTRPVAQWIGRSAAALTVPAAQLGDLAVDDEVVAMAWTLAVDEAVLRKNDTWFRQASVEPWTLAAAVCG